MKKLVTFLSLVGLILGIVFGYLWNQFSFSPNEKLNQAIIYEVKTGQSLSTVAHDLQRNGLIKSAFLFQIYARIRGDHSKMKVGEYELGPNLTQREILNRITSGKSILRSFTVAEGLNIFEVAHEFEKQGFGESREFLKLCQDSVLISELIGDFFPRAKTLEGYLFPETYKLTKYVGARGLIRQMVKRFFAVIDELNFSYLKNFERGVQLNSHELVTLASIVEKETGASSERPLIASVFFNRLKKGMRLQTDPTILYGKTLLSGHLEGNITKTDLTTPNPYNTYLIKGLPPGPIANPGRESLKAVLSPAQSSFFYFVSQNDGTHIFSEEYAQHEKAVAKFQLNRMNRENKSWRDLKNKKK